MPHIWQMLQDLWNWILSVIPTTTVNTVIGITSIVVAVLPYLYVIYSFLYQKTAKRQILHFWKGYAKDRIKVVVTEYKGGPITDTSLNILGITGDYRLYSKGIVYAVSHLRSFFDRNLSQIKVEFMGYERADLNEGNFVVIGTPIANEACKFFFNLLQEHYDCPFDVLENKTHNRIELKYSNDKLKRRANKIFYGEITETEKTGHDYALIVKFKYHENQWAILVMSSLSFGSFEGAYATTDLKIIKEVTRITKNADCFAFIIKTDIFRDESLRPTVEWSTVTPLYKRQISKK